MQLFSELSYSIVLFFMSQYHNSKYLLVEVEDGFGVGDAEDDTSVVFRKSGGKLIVIS